MRDAITTDVLVIGSGIAGCAAALAAARNGAEVRLVTKATRPEDAATDWAQGGIATTRERPGDLKADILEASDGTADPEAVDVLVSEADEAIEDVLVETLDVPFDTIDGDFDYGREAAHSTRRILHVDASTGRYILRPFLAHLETVDGVTIEQDTAALDLITHEGRVHGALLDNAPEGEPVFAGNTILATGGIGSVYPVSTNPPDATGDGIAMAALAGADVSDMAFVQFHPTAYDPGEGVHGETFLVSEAVRGEGATLVNDEGERFMPDYHEDAELAPRDVVARAVEAEREETGRVYLDVSAIDFETEFPEISQLCADHDVNPADGIPVKPCQHFCCGGIDVDDRGRASLDHLYAVGECSRTGVHGANRLASTSLLEGLVWGLRAGEDAVGAEPAPINVPSLANSDPELPDRFAEEKFTRLRRVMGDNVGIRRNESSLREAGGVLRRLKGEVDAYVRTRTSRSLYELRNAVIVGLLVTRDAAAREESVGCHYRSDSGESSPEDAL